jgi:hypothetical protein
MEEINTTKQNTLISLLASSWKVPNPSVSITSMDRFSVNGSGYTHSQIPLVQGLTEEPIVNIPFLSSITLFSR